MIKPPFDLIDPNTPLMFDDGQRVYEEFLDKFPTHKSGFFILAPSGAGKSHFTESEAGRDWIDGDNLWKATKAHPDEAWWLKDNDYMKEIDARSDVITQQYRKMGFLIVGASNTWLKPDAVVLPPWETHKKWIMKRDAKNKEKGADFGSAEFVAGATSDMHEQVLFHREVIGRWTDKGVPKFNSVAEAATFLTAL